MDTQEALYDEPVEFSPADFKAIRAKIYTAKFDLEKILKNLDEIYEQWKRENTIEATFDTVEDMFKELNRRSP